MSVINMNLNLVPQGLSPDEIFVLRFDYALIWKLGLYKYLTKYGTQNSPQSRFRGGWRRRVGSVHVLIEGGEVREELRHSGHTRVPVSGGRHEAGTKGTWSRQTVFH